MNLRQLFVIAVLLLVGMSQTGCASFNKKLKAWLGGGSAPSQAEAPPKPQVTKFSDSGDVAPRVRRNYKRTTKESLRDDSALEAKAGSLWVNEGQGAYLFSQNVVRLVGDPLAVTLEGDPKDQIQSKVGVIKQLLAKIEERQKARMRGPASEDGKEKSDDAGDKEAKDDSKKDAAKKDKAGQQAGAQPETPTDIGIKTVPTRIVERTVDGNYRVKGLQPFMIGSREYKVIVTGVVRAEDFNEEGISSTKLLDSKFDIVSARRKDAEL